jgi:hypothetical protein
MERRREAGRGGLGGSWDRAHSPLLPGPLPGELVVGSMMVPVETSDIPSPSLSDLRETRNHLHPISLIRSNEVVDVCAGYD